ncbi:hypothetical protein CSAL01_09640 [Colletotrichum salicis]|uniref:AttH domain-containing protein n=1 Tax=Colletotrichum salicis TaxID=1209931 RepID=A0A135SWC3_9PEZI|nr:hypothetical protein CSAL01_09640 [Colletotrichum salicis]
MEAENSLELTRFSNIEPRFVNERGLGGYAAWHAIPSRVHTSAESVVMTYHKQRKRRGLELGDADGYRPEHLPVINPGSRRHQGNLTIKNGLLDIEVQGSAFKSGSSDSFSTLNTWGEYDAFAFNLTFDASSPVILNAGVGRFRWGTGTTMRWSLPSCLAKGSFTINGTTLEVDPTRSLTWYDRQHGVGGPNNFTWFGLNFPGGIGASIWYSDTAEPNQQLRFATIRAEDGLHIVRFKMIPGNATTWTSPVTNTTYAQNWRLFFDNGDTLAIKSIRQDQEKGAGAGRFHSGVVEAEGSLFGQQKGFGFVDIAPKLS